MEVKDIEKSVRRAFKQSSDELLNLLLQEALKQKETGEFLAKFDVWQAAWIVMEEAGHLENPISADFLRLNERYSLFGHAVHNIFNDMANTEQRDMASGLLARIPKPEAKRKPHKQKRKMKMKPTLPDTGESKGIKIDPKLAKMDELQAASLETAIREAEQAKEAERAKELSAQQEQDPFNKIRIKHGDTVYKIFVLLMAEASICAALQNRGHDHVTERFAEQLESLLKSGKKSSTVLHERVIDIYNTIETYGTERACLIALPNHMSREQRELFYKLMTELGKRTAYPARSWITSLSEYRAFEAENLLEQKRINEKKLRGEMPHDWHLAEHYKCELYDPNTETSIIRSWRIAP